jgi:hypothetical protein
VLSAEILERHNAIARPVHVKVPATVIYTALLVWTQCSRESVMIACAKEHLWLIVWDGFPSYYAALGRINGLHYERLAIADINTVLRIDQLHILDFSFGSDALASQSSRIF